MVRKILVTAVASLALLLGAGSTGVAAADSGSVVALFPPRCC